MHILARVIFHIDINAFFASAEEIKNPRLKGLPVAVGSTSRRSVISTANYKAREYGVHSAMPVYAALEKCPDLILCEGDYSYYRALSARFFAYLKKYSKEIEPASIDECYMDLTQKIKEYKRPLDLAYQIQNGIYEELGLKVSIGIAPNKFLAKMASDMRKPMGITVLRKAEIKQKLWPLPIEDIHGLGKKSIPILKKEGIETIGDFANEENENLIYTKLGKNGYSLIQKVRGNSTNQLNVSTSQKSVSLSRTYENDLYTMEEVQSKIEELTQELSDKLRKENQKGKMVSLSLRDLSFHTIVRSYTFSQYVNEYPILLQAFNNLLEENFKPVGYRYVAIHLGSLKDAKQIMVQPSLFEKPIQDTNDILHQLNHRIEGIHLMKASDLLKEKNDE